MLQTEIQSDLRQPSPPPGSSPHTWNISDRRMTLAEYAQLTSALGSKIVCRDNLFWRQVRPFFYRPLLPLEPFDPEAIVPPCRWPGGYQYVVRDPRSANSTMNFLAYDAPHSYSLENLGHNRRRLIKNAAKSFQIRPIVDFGELKTHGHRAYLSFFHRTKYAYKSERATRAGFDRWVDTIADFPKAIVLGGYGRAGLTAVSVSYWLLDTLWYATLFSETASMKEGVCELMLHELRQIVAAEPGISRLIARPYRGGNSLDRYYMTRGCKIIRFPARFEISPPFKFFMERLLPGRYAAICGNE